jgi:hypothetical protein
VESSSALRATLAGLLMLAPCPPLSAEPDATARITIRSRGADVVIEGDRAAFPRPLADVGRTTLAEAVRLKRKGEEDAAVIAYLRTRRADLPAIIAAGDVPRLRGAGAGRSVVAYLASVAAVDVGPTGEGRESVAGESSALTDLEGPSGAVAYAIGGYPAYFAAPDGFRPPPRLRRAFEGRHARPLPSRRTMPRATLRGPLRHPFQ